MTINHAIDIVRCIAEKDTFMKGSKLHSILFIMQIRSLHKRGRKLFSDPMIVTSYGIRVPSIRYSYGMASDMIPFHKNMKEPLIHRYEVPKRMFFDFRIPHKDGAWLHYDKEVRPISEEDMKFIDRNMDELNNYSSVELNKEIMKTSLYKELQFKTADYPFGDGNAVEITDLSIKEYLNKL